MTVLSADEIDALVSMPALIARLREAFGREAYVPPRLVTDLPGGGERHLFLMPAFDTKGYGVVKAAVLIPANPDRGLPAVQSVVVVFSGLGTPVAILDGASVTRLRTGAASALASTYLSRPDSDQLVLFGTGALAPAMAIAHCAARPIRQVMVCGRHAERAEATVVAIRAKVAGNVVVQTGNDPEVAVRRADIVSCATGSASPLFDGRWLRPGTHVDLVGSFSPTKREADDETVRRARIYVDTFAGALSEAGDLLEPIARGILERESIVGELADLVCGRVEGRRNDQEITLFKSVGTAIEDLAAARLVVESAVAKY